MAEAAIVELKPGFRALIARLREFRRLFAFAVSHLDFVVSMMESEREGALQFVVLFSPADGRQGHDVRIIFAEWRGDFVSIAVRGGGRNGKHIGLRRVDDLALRQMIDIVLAEAVERVRAIPRQPVRLQDWSA